MSDQVAVHGFETSNNMKVRIGLGFKGIPYEFHSIDPGNRDAVVQLSGQHLTPVLVHGDRVVFDSAAILRYLDTTFPATPKLFGRTRDEQWQIEDWELFARAWLAGPMMEVVHTRVGGGEVDDAMMDRCATAFGEAVTTLADGLADRTWLVGDRLSAADITAAAVLTRVRGAALLPVPASGDALVPWEEQVMRYDGECRLPGTTPDRPS